MAYGNGHWVAVGWGMQETTDPIPRAVVRLGETSVGVSAKNSILLYRDAVTPVWTGTSQQATAVTAGDRFVAVGNPAGIWTSEDGKTWSPAMLPALE